LEKLFDWKTAEMHCEQKTYLTTIAQELCNIIKRL